MHFPKKHKTKTDIGMNSVALPARENDNGGVKNVLNRFEVEMTIRAKPSKPGHVKDNSTVYYSNQMLKQNVVSNNETLLEDEAGQEVLDEAGQEHSIEVSSEEKVDEKKKKSQEQKSPAESITTVTLPTWEETRQKVIVSTIVVMVLVHPTLTRKSVQLLTCESLGENDPNRYLRRDLQIVCWQGSHFVWATLIGIPFLVLYAAGIPLVSVFVMYRRKHKLHTDKSTVSRFGFLYL